MVKSAQQHAWQRVQVQRSVRFNLPFAMPECTQIATLELYKWPHIMCRALGAWCTSVAFPRLIS